MVNKMLLMVPLVLKRTEVVALVKVALPAKILVLVKSALAIVVVAKEEVP